MAKNIRAKYGTAKGTQLFVDNRGGEIPIKPVADEYIESMAGMTGTKGMLLKALAREKARERRRQCRS